MSDLPKGIRHKQKILRGLEQRRNMLRVMIVENNSVIQTLESDIITMFNKLLSAYDEKPTCRQIGVHDDPDESLARELNIDGSKKSGDLKAEDFTVTTPKSDYSLPFTREKLLKVAKEYGEFVLPKDKNAISDDIKKTFKEVFYREGVKQDYGDTEMLQIRITDNTAFLVLTDILFDVKKYKNNPMDAFMMRNIRACIMLGELKE